MTIRNRFCRDKHIIQYNYSGSFSSKIIIIYIFFFNFPEFKTTVARDCINGLRFEKMPSANVTMFGIRFTDKTFKNLKKQKKPN